MSNPSICHFDTTFKKYTVLATARELLRSVWKTVSRRPCCSNFRCIRASANFDSNSSDFCRFSSRSWARNLFSMMRFLRSSMTTNRSITSASVNGAHCKPCHTWSHRELNCSQIQWTINGDSCAISHSVCACVCHSLKFDSNRIL